MRPAAVHLGPIDPRDLPKRHCSLGRHQWPTTKNLPHKVWAECRHCKLRAAACSQMHGPSKVQSGTGCLTTGPLWAICELGGAGSQEDMGWSRPISRSQCSFRTGRIGGVSNPGKMAPICSLPCRRAHEGSNGGCLSSLCSSATQFSPSLYVSHTSQAADPLLVPRGMSGFSGSFYLTRMGRTGTDFYSKILWKLFFPGLEPRAGEPPCGARDPHSFMEASAAVLSLLGLSHHAWVWDQPASCLQLVSMWLFLYSLRCMC